MFHKIKSFGNISKIIVNHTKLVWLWRNSTTDISLANFWGFDKFFWMLAFKVFTSCKTLFKVGIKSLIFPQLLSLWCLYYNIWTRFYLLYVIKESEIVARESYMKNMFVKNSTKFTEKHLRRGLLRNKVHCTKNEASIKISPVNVTADLVTFSEETLRFICSGSIWQGCFPVCEISKNIYFANVCERLPLKSKIVTGVHFRKILGFYYKRNRQLFFYDGTFPWKFLSV